ncbi:MAG: ferritin-like domain-containing protein [Polyangiaceae bacterium]|nr:ferritin-like domain-containing protein [Polyangiaceae bacterium]
MPRRPAKEPPSELVRHEWAGRIEAEYRSAAITQETVLWLIQIGASPDLVRAGLRIVDDELVHAEMSRKVWSAAGGEALAPLDRGSLGLRREHEVLEHDVVSAIVKVFCLGETVAVPLFANLRKHTTVPVARRALDRILKDEVRHRDFGWTCLEWLLARPDAEELRGVVHRGLDGWLRALEGNYGDDLQGGIRGVTPEERAWGVAPWREYAEILHRAYTRDYARRFAKLGVSMPALPAS